MNDLHIGNVTDSRTSILPGATAFPGAEKIRPKGKVISFLRELREKSGTSEGPEYLVVDNAFTFWRDLREYLPVDEPEPVAALSPRGSIHFSWELPTLYVEAEVFKDRTEVFCEDDLEGEFQSAEFQFQGYRKEAKWVADRIKRDAARRHRVK